MATILSFTPRKPARPAVGPGLEAAAIIIFPGVRYEQTGAAERMQGGAETGEDRPAAPH
jgi:hypothetical protein